MLHECIRRSARHGTVGLGDDLGLWLSAGRNDAVDVARRSGAAAAQDEVDRAVAGIELAIGGVCGNDRPRLAGIDSRARGCVPANIVITASNRPAALVVVVMAAEHQVDAILIEERQPGFANAFVGAIAVLRGTE